MDCCRFVWKWHVNTEDEHWAAHTLNNNSNRGLENFLKAPRESGFNSGEAKTRLDKWNVRFSILSQALDKPGCPTSWLAIRVHISQDA